MPSRQPEDWGRSAGDSPPRWGTTEAAELPRLEGRGLGPGRTDRAATPGRTDRATAPGRVDRPVRTGGVSRAGAASGTSRDSGPESRRDIGDAAGHGGVGSDAGSVADGPPSEAAAPGPAGRGAFPRLGRFLRRVGREDGTPRYLILGETEVCRARRHWVVLIRPAGWLLASVLVAGLLSGADPGVDRFASILVLVALTHLFLRVLMWWDFEYVLTDKRILQVMNVPMPRVASMSLRKVTDMTYQQSLLGWMAGYGTFHIESAGQNQALGRLSHVARSAQFYERLTTQVFTGGASREF